MKILAVTAQKGGVGKTTLALHLAWAAKEQGKRVLMIDFDPQGNASQTLTGELDINIRRGGSGVLFERGKAIEPLDTASGIALLHGHQYLDAATDHVPTAIERGNALRALPFDTIIVDTPPSASALLAAPYYWADRLVLPITPDAFSVRGLVNVHRLIDKARRENPELAERLILNMYARHIRSAREFVAAIASTTDLKQPYLHSSNSVARATEAGVPVWAFRLAGRDHRTRPAPQEIRGQWQILCRGLLDD